jgi:3-deoxy-7-phosphoheptulonate synthase
MLVIFNDTNERAVRELLTDPEVAQQSGAVCRIGDRVVAHLPRGSRELAERLAEHGRVERVLDTHPEWPLAAREAAAERSVVPIGSGAEIGGDFALIAGPCAVENPEQLSATASIARAGGAVALRGGAYKPRTSPYAFQGLKQDGLRMLAEVRAETGLPVVTEVVDTDTVDAVAEVADVLQIGTRNAQNFSLLSAAGRTGRPVLLKRGFGCTVSEWLGAAEYILAQGNSKVILCERGIRTFEGSTRFTLDLSAIPVVKQLSHLPVIVDPSHGTGHRHLVRPLALAAAAVGADGLLLDIHTDGEQALCDGKQALSPSEWLELTAALSSLLSSLGRTLQRPKRMAELGEPVGAGV